MNDGLAQAAYGSFLFFLQSEKNVPRDGGEVLFLREGSRGTETITSKRMENVLLQRLPAGPGREEDFLATARKSGPRHPGTTYFKRGRK